MIICVVAGGGKRTADVSKPMVVELLFKEEGTKQFKMPVGAGEVEIHWEILPHIPENVNELTNVLIVSKAKAEIVFGEGDRGKWVRIKAHWISPSGEAGLWTLTISIMIP